MSRTRRPRRNAPRSSSPIHYSDPTKLAALACGVHAKAPRYSTAAAEVTCRNCIHAAGLRR